MRSPRRHGRNEPAAPQAAPAAAEPETVRLDPTQLSGLFAAPGWLRDLGVMSWLAVGFGALVIGLVWLAAQLETIVIPVILGSVLAAVAAPLVSGLGRRGVPRLGAAALVLLLLVLIGIGILLLVFGGLMTHSGGISSAMDKAADEVAGWLGSLGISESELKSELKQAVPDAGKTLIEGIGPTITGLASTATAIVLTAFSALFVLKDGPVMRRWAERHMGLPEPIARIVTGETIHALRQYFLGVTIVALFNAAVIGAAALILGIPLPGTIAVVTFVAAYVPFFGAWLAGAFAVALALSAGSTSDALIIAIVALLANGVLQQIVQPIAFGATLQLNPLVVLIATIGGGCLFGMLGLVLTAPIVSAAVNIAGRIAAARAPEARDSEERGPGMTPADASPEPAT